MGSPSARRLTQADYGLVQAALNDLVCNLRADGRKAVYAILDVPTTLRSLYAFDHAYIVEDSFLVVYDVGAPWYSQDAILSELLVLRLLPGSSFTAVADFLTNAAREAGAKLAAVGTALAKSDAALASLYSKNGFTEAARSLVKEI